MNSSLSYFTGKATLPSTVFNPYFIPFSIFNKLSEGHNIILGMYFTLLLKKLLNNNYHLLSFIPLIQVTFSVMSGKEAYSCKSLCLERSLGLEQHCAQKAETPKLKSFFPLRVGLVSLKHFSSWLPSQPVESSPPTLLTLPKADTLNGQDISL